jgi:dienelactone hydrolase
LLRRGSPATCVHGLLTSGSPRRPDNPPMRDRDLQLAVLPLFFGLTLAQAASTVPLPAWMCADGNADIVFRGDFETTVTVPHDPSNGSGGPYPGDQSRVITVPGLGSHLVYLHLPANYTPAHAWPLLLAMHGTAGTSGAAPAAARQVRSDWSGISDSRGIIVLAPAASGANGSWEPDIDVPAISAALDDMIARYNVEQTRIDMWGYSAGGHLAHSLALNNTDYFAAYGVSAGALTQYACTDNGSPPPSCNALLGAAEPKIPVDIHIGVEDPLYLYYGANQDAARFESNGWVPEQDLFYRPFAGGHTYTIAQLGEIWTNVCPFALGP